MKWKINLPLALVLAVVGAAVVESLVERLPELLLLLPLWSRQMVCSVHVCNVKQV